MTHRARACSSNARADRRCPRARATSFALLRASDGGSPAKRADCTPGAPPQRVDAYARVVGERGQVAPAAGVPRLGKRVLDKRRDEARRFRRCRARLARSLRCPAASAGAGTRAACRCCSEASTSRGIMVRHRRRRGDHCAHAQPCPARFCAAISSRCRPRRARPAYPFPTRENVAPSAVPWISTKPPRAGHDHVHVGVAARVLVVVEIEHRHRRRRCRPTPRRRNPQQRRRRGEQALRLAPRYRIATARRRRR